MKKQIIGALLLSASLLTAQAQPTEKPVAVRVKKTERVNGVEKTTDTTYYVNGPVNITTMEGVDSFKQEGKQVVIITDEIHSDKIRDINSDDLLDEQVQRALKAAGVDGKTLGVDKMIVLNDSAFAGGDKKTTKIVIMRTIKISEPSEEDTRMLGKQTGFADGKLELEKIAFYPNPGTGKFNLTFALAEKGNTDVTILNMEGRTIYHEKLPAFSGNYDKEIDISENPKGIYFVKVEQGKHAQVKKFILQ